MMKYTLIILALLLTHSASSALPKLTLQQMHEEFDQTVSYINRFAVHKDLNSKKFGINYEQQFSRLRNELTKETDICEFQSLINRTLNLVQDLHATTMDSGYLKQYAQYQTKYNFDNTADFSSIEAIETECKKAEKLLELPIIYSNGEYQFYLSVSTTKDMIPMGSVITHVNEQPVSDFILSHPDEVWPYRFDSNREVAYQERFYRALDKPFTLTTKSGASYRLDPFEAVEVAPKRKQEVSYFSQKEPRIYYFNKENTLYIGLSMMNTDYLPKLKQEISAIASTEEIARIIIDIRGNPGGNDSTWHQLLMHLVDEPQKLGFDIRFKYNKDTVEFYAKDDTVTALQSELLDGKAYWRKPSEIMVAEVPEDSIRFTGPIYLAQDKYIYSSAGNFSNYARFSEQLISVGDTTDLTGGAQIEPLFFKLPYSGIIFRLEPVLDFKNVESLGDFDHNQVELPFEMTAAALRDRETTEAELYSKEYLLNRDPLIRYILDHQKN